MMKILALILVLVVFSYSNVNSQKYWVYFADKGSSEKVKKSLNSPESLLGNEFVSLIKKRRKLDVTDLPVNKEYIYQIESAGYHISGQSRWLNAVVIDSVFSIIHLQLSCRAIARVEPVRISNNNYIDDKETHSLELVKSNSFYGEAKYQNDIINIKYLHDKGYTGNGVKIAVLDAGFKNIYKCNAFNKIHNDSLIIDKWRAYDNGRDIDIGEKHGTYVLSTMASYIPDKMVGVAYDASYILIIVQFEPPYNEDYWIYAAEYAEKKGARIIQSSVGYFYAPFDSSSFYYTYDVMDGHTTAVTRAADIAASKGILVVNAAGNSGYNMSLGLDIHIVAPADGDSVIAVGSVNRYGEHHAISSYGPSFDGRIKPDLMAMGNMAALMGDDENTIIRENGTSFSAPVISGLAACLMQAHPERSNMEIFDALKKSASNYSDPDTILGYGVPNAEKADSILLYYDGIRSTDKESLYKVYPTIVVDYTNIFVRNINVKSEYFIIDLSGRVVLKDNIYKNKSNRINMSSFNNGIYFVVINNSNSRITKKIVKI